MSKFIVPNYYENFCCKGGACRHSCCEGWPISVSMSEYFRLLGQECSEELRRKLDISLHIADAPSPERYAQILPNWQGDCPMHRADGYCSLQCECGADALSEICRLYPRSPRHFVEPECACSNSCEHTLELLFAQDAPLTFIPKDLPFDPPAAPTDVSAPVQAHYRALRAACIDRLQNRAQSLPERIVRVGRLLNRLNSNLDHFEEMLSAQDAPIQMQINETFALSVLAAFNRAIGLERRSVEIYAQNALQTLALFDEDPSEGSWKRFHEMKARFHQRFPRWEIHFEQVLVNHVFYETFPFADRYETLKDAFVSLAAVYAYLAFLAITWIDAHPECSDLIDVTAAAFRLIDHSAFDRNAAVVLRSRMQLTTPEIETLIFSAL